MNTTNKQCFDAHSAETKVLFPFRIGVEPMKRLLIASFDNHDEYEAIEPQLFDDAINGTGIRVLVYRRDKLVDVYYQKGVRINWDTFSIGSGIDTRLETIIEPSVFQISDGGVNLHVVFTDKHKRVVELKICEKTTSKKRLTFLAPVGNDITQPKQLFLAFMKEFDFVARANTLFYAKVGDIELKPSGFPISRNGKRVFFARYSNKPIVGTLNPVTASPLIVPYRGEFSLFTDGMNITFGPNGVTSISMVYEGVDICVDFEKGVPNLFELKEKILYSDNWTYRIDNQVVTGGEFRLRRTMSLVKMQLDINKEWVPKGLPFSFRLFTYFASFFRKWPTTYYWEGSIDLTLANRMQSSWKRK